MPMSLAAQAEERVERDSRKKGVSSPVKERKEEGRRGLHPLLLAGPVVASGLDAYTTDRNLDAGAVETNPRLAGIAGNDAALYGVQLLRGLGTALAAEALARRGHKTLGKLLAAAGIVAPLTGVARNIDAARDRP